MLAMEEKENKKLNKSKTANKSKTLSQTKEKNKEPAENLKQSIQPAVQKTETLQKESEEMDKQPSEEPKKLSKIQELMKLRKEKKAQAIKQVEKTEQEVKTLPAKQESKDEKIVFEEYKPKFYETSWFRWAILGGVLLIAGIIALIVAAVNNKSNQVPTSISFSTDTMIYWNTTEDITLRAYLNSDYSGEDKTIKLSVSGGSGVISLSKYEITSGESFAIKIVTKNGYPVGGKPTIWATSSVNGISTSLEILIDSPATRVTFLEKGSSSIYLLDETNFEAVAKRGDEIIPSKEKVITGRNVEYTFFYEKEGGSYKKEETPYGDRFELIKQDEEQIEKKYAILKVDIATVNGRVIKANEEAKVYVQASVKKWSDYNTGEEKDVVFTDIREIEQKRIDLTNLSINNFFIENTPIIEKDETKAFDYSSLLSISAPSSFSEAQISKCLKFLEISIGNLTFVSDKTGAKSGSIYFNTETSNYEWFDGSEWREMISTGEDYHYTYTDSTNTTYFYINNETQTFYISDSQYKPLAVITKTKDAQTGNVTGFKVTHNLGTSTTATITVEYVNSNGEPKTASFTVKLEAN